MIDLERIALMRAEEQARSFNFKERVADASCARRGVPLSDRLCSLCDNRLGVTNRSGVCSRCQNRMSHRAVARVPKRLGGRPAHKQAERDRVRATRKLAAKGIAW